MPSSLHHHRTFLYGEATDLMALSDSDTKDTIFGPPDPSMEALRRLSDNLGSLLQSPAFDFCADARIVAGPDREVAVHRCMLAARSPFFRELFARRESMGAGERLELGELVPGFEVGFDPLMAVLGYLYSGRMGPLPSGVCECVDEECPHLACRPAVDFIAQALYASFAFQISELVSLFQRQFLDILEKVAIDDMLVILSVANLCTKACTKLLMRCIEIVAESDLDVVTLEKALPQDVVKQTMEWRSNLALDRPGTTSVSDKHVERMHKALDSDDVELVRMLVEEGHTTLDESYALHYAISHCDLKITTELLNLGLADVNHRNLRGYTVLHVAAMRKEPKIIVALLTRGACPSYLTSDGKKALQISKRLVRYVDFYRSTEEGKASPKDRLCIEILQQAERGDPLVLEVSISLATAGEALREKLLYLENRVGLAKLLFPMEAQVVMDIAHVDGTLEFTSHPTSNLSFSKKKTMDYLNNIPFEIKEVHLSRIRALSRTVRLGRHYFPRCSEVLEKIVDDDLSEFTCLGHSPTEERKRRYLELQEEITKAFSEDKESALFSPSSSKSRVVRTKFTKN